MSSTAQQTQNSITLKGSAKLVVDYLNYGINSILFQRGIYPPESFKCEEHFGISILVSTDEKINSFVKNVLGQIQEWLLAEKIKMMSLVIANITTKEILERWDFKIQYENRGESNKENSSAAGKKDLKIIQKEIRDVLLQICSTVSFLPLLDCPCSFDLLIHTDPAAEVPEEWAETGPCFIANSQELQLRSFSTSYHRMNTVVSYKAE